MSQLLQRLFRSLTYRVKHLFQLIKQHLEIRIKLSVLRKKQLLALKATQKKKVIRIAFLTRGVNWKSENLFHYLNCSNKYHPFVVVCPNITKGDNHMFKSLENTYNFFKKKGFETYNTYNKANNSWIDIKKDLKPDIVFFLNPHNRTLKQYRVENYLDMLTCYIPYAFRASNNYYKQFNQPFHNYIWKAFYETEIHKSIGKKHAINKGSNIVVSGYPGTDIFIDKSHNPHDPWKENAKRKKRVIYAPHHSIKPGSMFSTFLKYGDEMLKIASDYSDKISFCFKPHGLLKFNLYKHPEWGKSRTDEYYKKWTQLPNGQYKTGDYIDLFLYSDAMIHDCSSFITEYLFIKKPVLYIIKDNKMTQRLNDWGKLAHSKLYHAHSISDIKAFLDEIVIGGKDIKREDRELFLNKHLIPPEQVTPSKMIFNYLNNALDS